MYMPSISGGRVTARYQLGEYLLVMFTECESSGMIVYDHVLYVFPLDKRAPIFAVASEISAFAQQLDPDQRFLGVFPGEGHLNYGLSPDWLDLDKFTARALELVAAHFEIESAPVRLPLDPSLN